MSSPISSSIKVEPEMVWHQSLSSTLKRSGRRKPKVCSQWTEDDIFTLIACVEKETLLWNSGEKGYSIFTSRQNSWEKIAKNGFNNKYSHTELNAKWTNLRIQYRSYFPKKTKPSQGQVTVKWKYFNVMSFLGQSYEIPRSDPISNSSTDESDTGYSFASDSDTAAAPTKKQNRTTNANDSETASINCIKAGYSSVASDSDTASTKKQNRTANANDTAAASINCIAAGYSSVANGNDSAPAKITNRATNVNDTTTASREAVETLSVAVASTIPQQIQDDRNNSFCRFILSELQALNADKAKCLRARLQRVLLEFNEEHIENELNLM